MNRKMALWLVVFAFLALCLHAQQFNNAADFRWTVANNQITITGYAGAGNIMRVPPTIQGMPVVAIGTAAFLSGNLSLVILPGSVTSIGPMAFASNQISAVSIPTSVTSIGQLAFADNQLTSVTIPYGVTSIGYRAFHGNELSLVTIPDSVVSIGEMAFGDAVLLRPDGSELAIADMQQDTVQTPVAPVAQTPVTPVAPSRVASMAGTIVPGDDLAEKLLWLQRSAESHNTYIVEVRANENIHPQTLGFPGGINITVIFVGDHENRVIRLASHGAMFTVNRDVTFTLGDNITLHGHNGNNNALINLNGGTLVMNAGATITGNLRSITENTGGGGVHIGQGGSFTMNGGTISGNSARNGGGVFLAQGGSAINLNGGTISGNTAITGGGVNMVGSRFTPRQNVMRGGTIIGNIANYGGGVAVGSDDNAFNMQGGTITGNVASSAGGGVWTQMPRFNLPNFTKSGGIITGHTDDPANGNVVRDDAGVLARRGHAVFVRDDRRREITANLRDALNSGTAGAQGGWAH